MHQWDQSIEEGLITVAKDITRFTENLGLGLYIAIEIFISRAGSISVTSTETDGMTFEVKVPRIISKHYEI